MGIRKQHALPRQLIHVWSPGLRVPLKGVRPVIQIIDGDEQYVGPLFSPYICMRFRRTKQQNGQGDDRNSFHWCVISSTVCPRRTRPAIGLWFRRRGI